MNKRAILLGVVTAWVLTTTAFAADPIGVWLVAERNGPDQHCRLRRSIVGRGVLGGRLQGAWTEKNPDPAKRSRPTLAMPVLLGDESQRAKPMGRSNLQFGERQDLCGEAHPHQSRCTARARLRIWHFVRRRKLDPRRIDGRRQEIARRNDLFTTRTDALALHRGIAEF